MEADNEIACVGFIMDGNRRWARQHNLETLEGHAQGYSILRKMIPAVMNAKIPNMVCYAFSTENWNRSETEVSYLMALLERAVSELVAEIEATHKKINVRVIGQINRLPESLQKAILRTEAKNTDTPDITVWIAFSYGGRAEIVEATNAAIVKGEHITEADFEKSLWTNGMPDPDLIIRTSGEYRISNFLLWQLAYSELFFTDTLWPDFGETEFQSILEEYGKRKRRHGE